MNKLKKQKRNEFIRKEEKTHTTLNSNFQLLNSKSGITLIALVVTIVVLLILAGITINLVLADGGIFGKANEAVIAQKLGEYKDKIELAKMAVLLDKDNLGELPMDKFLEELKNQGIIKEDSQIKTDAGTGIVTITPEEGIEIQIKPELDENGNPTGNVGEIIYPTVEEIIQNGGGTSGGDSGNTGGGSTTVIATGVALNKTNANLTVGKTLTLTPTVTPNNTTDKTVTWKSSDESIATVENGVVTAKGAGETTITATTADGSNRVATCSITTLTPIESIVSKSAIDTNQMVGDEYSNKIVVPADFTVVAHGTDNVEYTYDKENGTSTNIPVVQDGIVIKDGEGNQFVWVPVGEIKNDAVENTTNITNIKLGRYENFTMGTNNTPPEPKQLAENWATNDSTTLIDSYYQEYATNSSYANTKAYDLEDWINSALANRGYYIARYEASKNGEKAASKTSTGSPATSNTATISNGMLWSNITQPNAAIAAKAMYPKSEDESVVDNYYSDLINSYAWDTAIIFIQTYSGNTTYASQTSKNTGSPANTGERTSTTTDKVCNIYDMASNVCEWTTESSANSSGPCVYRGGIFGNTSHYTSIRLGSSTSGSNYNVAFRPSLCVSSTVE